MATFGLAIGYHLDTFIGNPGCGRRARVGRRHRVGRAAELVRDRPCEAWKWQGRGGGGEGGSLRL